MANTRGREEWGGVQLVVRLERGLERRKGAKWKKDGWEETRDRQAGLPAALAVKASGIAIGIRVNPAGRKPEVPKALTGAQHHKNNGGGEKRERREERDTKEGACRCMRLIPRVLLLIRKKNSTGRKNATRKVTERAEREPWEKDAGPGH